MFPPSERDQAIEFSVNKNATPCEGFGCWYQEGGQAIPSSNGVAFAGAQGTDIGNVGRNVLRGPRQTSVDFSVIKRFPFGDAKSVEFRAEFFNLFNQVNLANPITNLNAASINSNTGQITNPGDFGRIISASNNPRLIQFALKLNF